jgi:hypothetical protein
MPLFCLAKTPTLSYTPIFCHNRDLIRSLKSPSTISATGIAALPKRRYSATTRLSGLSKHFVTNLPLGNAARSTR